jgi:hypothetical protein
MRALSEQQTQAFKLHWQCCLFMLSDIDQEARRGVQHLPLHTEYWRPSLLPLDILSARYHARVMCKSQMQGRPVTIIYLPQLRVASTSHYAIGKIVFLSWSPWQTINSSRGLSTPFLMLIMHNHYLVDCHFFALFCLDNSRAPIHDAHRIPYSQRDTS